MSFFDVGSGPGTGLWAADAIFSEIKEYMVWEIDEGFNHLSETLTQAHPILKNALRRKEFRKRPRFFSADLVLMSYSIGEIPLNIGILFFSSCGASYSIP
jgi:ribosomal protein RSM22 (predicted rRNA methylase)